MTDHRKATLLLGVALTTFAAPAAAQTRQTATAVDPDPAGGPDTPADPAQDIVVTGKTTRSVTQITGVEIQKILPGISPLKALETLPGVTFLTADPWGNNEQNISLFIHGFNQQQLGYTLD
ncbi:TonB-dependent receptor plug domain-containing protein, partial [uncultured Sphingomonas sp.]